MQGHGLADGGPAVVAQDRGLEGYGYKPDAVRSWTRAKARTVLDGHKKADAATVRRAKEKAADLAGEKDRGQPTVPERLEVAAYLDAIAGGDPDERCAALGHSLLALSDDEFGRLRGHLVRLLRGQTR